MHYVPAIEPGLAFWRDRLGFAATAEMPGEHALVFVILAGERIADRGLAGARSACRRHGLARALQRAVRRSGRHSTRWPLRWIARWWRRGTRHETFYGATEVAHRGPGGQFVTFARFARG